MSSIRQLAPFADVAFFSLPAAIPAALAAGSNVLEHWHVEFPKREQKEKDQKVAKEDASGKEAAPATQKKDEKAVQPKFHAKVLSGVKDIGLLTIKGMKWAAIRTLNGIGWIGTRVFTVASVACGLIAVVYLVAKALFVYMLNAITLRKIKAIDNYDKFSRAEASISFVFLGALATTLVNTNLSRVKKDAAEIREEAKEDKREMSHPASYFLATQMNLLDVETIRGPLPKTVWNLVSPETFRKMRIFGDSEPGVAAA